jgi:hypothetical protein
MRARECARARVRTHGERVQPIWRRKRAKESLKLRIAKPVV